MQDAQDVDFRLEVKLNSSVNVMSGQDQGIIIDIIYTSIHYFVFIVGMNYMCTEDGLSSSYMLSIKKSLLSWGPIV